jgi:Ni/Co efflux regulator RcnB
MGVNLMKKLIIIAAAALSLVAPGLAVAGKSMPGMGGKPMIGGHHGSPTGKNFGARRNWGGKHNGRWVGGHRAPGGWNGYRRPSIGYALPSYWVSPSYYIGNYDYYGFSRPSAGYGWSRYYDDAVLTDRYGRVHDTAPNVDWDRYDAYDDSYAGEDYSSSYGYREEPLGARADGYDDSGRNYRGGNRGSGVAGAVIGGGFGAIAGSAIAGRGDRTEGAIIGGVLGAATGAAIGSASRGRNRDYRDDYGYGAPRYDNGGGYDDRYAYGRPAKVKKLKKKYRNAPRSRYDDSVYGGTWNGTWTGSYEGGPVRTYEGTYEGSAPHWDHRGGNRGPVAHQPTVGYPYPGPTPHHGYGYGYTHEAPEVTTVVVQSQPVTTTTTTVTEEVYYASAPRKRWAPRPKKVWKPRPKPRCVCR